MWKDILNEFIKPYIKDKNVLLILLVGSYAANNQNKYSDIDVYIIIKDEAQYRSRGNKLLNCYMIEYFINPINKVKEYLKDDFNKHRIGMANMLLNGILLYGNIDNLNKLKQEAKYYIDNPNKEKDPFKYYACWCAYDEYKAAKYHNKLQYYLCLKNLVECYLYNNGYNLLPDLKIERFFKDIKYRNNYHIGKFPNNKFNELVINCFNKPNKNNLHNLYEYVLKDGNFDINNFIFKEKL